MVEKFDHTQYEKEVQQRWGQTEQYKESNLRTDQYGKEDWDAAKAEGEAITDELAELLRDGLAPDSRQALDAAEKHRLHIDHWYYSCPKGIHRELGKMYLSDSRFTEYYEKKEPGLAEFVSRAFSVNAEKG